MKNKNAVILMTALVPTIGHKALIDFALNLVGPNGVVDVIVSTRSFEPVSGERRIKAFEEHYENTRVFFTEHADDNAPQNPSTDSEWQYWHDIVLGDGEYKYDYFVASEPYGKKMADLVGSEFIPFDIDRLFLSIKGSIVRDNIDFYFDQLLPEFAKHYVKSIVFFGQESTGKTTMTKAMNEEFMSYAIHEFARPYIEAMDDKSITSKAMNTVVAGQYALQMTAWEKWDRRFIFSDTDLLSTIGYYRIYQEKFGGLKCDHDINELFNQTRSNLYIVMNDEIPFEENELRYGGKERESTKQFWIDLMEEYGCNYYVVKATDYIEQLDELCPIIENEFDKDWEAIRDFKRE